MQRGTYLVTVTPGEVPGADVLVGILDALLQRGEVRPVLPVLVPEVVGVQAGEEEGGRNGTVLSLRC
jgi:hypothetical protein